MENTKLKFIEATDKPYYFKYECYCGTHFITSKYRVESGHTQSCGCKHSKMLVERNQAKRGILTKPKNQRLFTIILKNIKSGAASRNLAFELTREQVENLIQQPCTYCGIPHSKVDYNVDGSELKTNGIDRINSELGYTFENCVPCCRRCNFAKNDMTVAEFIDLCNRVSSFQSKS